MTGVIILGITYVCDNFLAEILACINKAAIGAFRTVIVNLNFRAVRIFFIKTVNCDIRGVLSSVIPVGIACVRNSRHNSFPALNTEIF